MKVRWGLLLAALAAGCGGPPQVKYQPGDANTAAGQTVEWTFDKDEPGKPPAGADVYSGAWEVRAEGDAPSPPNVLCQSGTKADFPALRLGDKVFANLEATVRFKPVSGKDDQAAGIIFRVQDKDNYYIVRANALENNVIFFRYGSGSRTTLKEGAVKVPSGQWQELKLEVEGNRLPGRPTRRGDDGRRLQSGRHRSLDEGRLGHLFRRFSRQREKRSLGMKWITRERVKVDRVACPWLIRKFIDPKAEFLFVPEDQVMEVAKREGATLYDVKGVEFGHHGKECSFDALVKKHNLDRDPAMVLLAKIVNGADTDNTLWHQPESAGLNAVAEGFRHLGFKNDHEINAAEWIVYDALYAYCQEMVRRGKSDGAFK